MPTILIKGPFTEAETRKFVSLVWDIEETRPEQTFEVYIDDPAQQGEIDEIMDTFNPPRAGYERVMRYWEREP